MCDHQHRARVVGQERLQPFDGVDVQVVRRLIKEEHIGRRHQRARQHHPSAPPAREAADWGVGWQLQTREHHFHALFQPPPVPFFELVLEATHFVERAGLPVCHLNCRVMVGGDQGT